MSDKTEKQTIKFSDICREVKLTTKNPLADGYVRYIGLEHLDSGSLKIKRWGDIAEDKPSFSRVFKKGQILFGRRRSYLRKAAIAEFDGICSSDIIVMEPSGNKNINGLLPFIIQSVPFWDWAIKNSAGGLSPRTKYKSLAQFQFNAPFDERLCSLERIFEKLVRAMDIGNHVKDESQQLYEKLVFKFVKYGLRDVQLNETKVGKIPGSWDIKPFGELFEVDSKNGLYKPQSYYGKGHKMVHMGEMFRSEVVTPEIIEHSVGVEDKELSSFSLESEDLLFARRSLVKDGAGLCCIYKGEANTVTFESSIIRVRLDKTIASPLYFNQFFRSRYGRWLMERIIQTVAASGITSSDLKKMLVPVPPLEEQLEINLLIEKAQVVFQQSNSMNEMQNRLLACLKDNLVN